MLTKKFVRSLLCLTVVLGFSTTVAMGANILFVSSMEADHAPGDDAIKTFLEGLGHTVTYIDDDDSEVATENAALASDLVYISESVGSGDIRDEITEIPIPIIVAEPYAWDEMGLVTDQGGNQLSDSVNITIIDPHHPMAAGYSGDVPVFTEPSDIPTGRTGEGAIVIARGSGNSMQNADIYFLYEQGAPLAVPANDGSGNVAAGIRIGFFTASPAAQQLLSQQGLDLLEAAVNYALGLSREDDLATTPTPSNGAINVPLSTSLSWTPGAGAERHIVYFGTDFDDVNEAGPDSTEILQGTVDVNNFGPLSLEGGTTYYWRIDELSGDATNGSQKGHVWTFTTIPVIAYDPRPANGEGASIPLVLRWSPGGDVVSHELYLGTESTALEHIATKPAADPTFTLRELEIGQTYYWRVDEVNNGVTYTGEIWNFTVTRRVVNIWFEAEEADEVRDPMLIYPAADGTDPVSDAEGQGQPSGGLYIGTPGSVSGNNDLWTFDGASFNFTVPAGTYAIWARVSNVQDDSFWVSIPDGQYDVPVNASGWILWNGISPATPDWHWVRVHSDDAPGNAVVNVTLEAGEHNLLILHRENENFLDAILITNELNLEATDLPDVVPEMLYTQAHHPNPQDGETEAPATAVLSWQPGAYVEGQSSKHRVFFSENFDDVNDGIGGVIQDIERYPVDGTLDLDFEKTYYWRVDEVNNTTDWDRGNIWRFTVANYYVLEDFEDYNDYEPDRIFDAWIDGWNITTNGSIIGYEDPDFEAGEHFVETQFVHNGSQSMPYFYDNTTADYSEATMTLSSLRDWTKQGIETLTIWYKGNPSAFVEEPAGTYTLAASGTDIWDTSDEFRYAFKQLSGNGSISAQVLSVENTDPWAKAGVMIRQTLEPNSKFAAVYITPGNGCRFQGRLTPVTDAVSDTSVATDEQIAITAPYWVRVERNGDSFNGYYSSDGVNWQAMSWNPQSIAMPTNVYIGMALTSHSSNVFGKAEFTNVQTTGTVSQQTWEQQAIGVEMPSNEPALMYVVLDGSAVVYNDNPDAALMTEWTEWNINMQEFADQGVDLANVEKIGIGFGDRNNPLTDGSGLVHFDDIRLYPSQSEPAP